MLAQDVTKIQEHINWDGAAMCLIVGDLPALVEELDAMTQLIDDVSNLNNSFLGNELSLSYALYLL